MDIDNIKNLDDLISFKTKIRGVEIKLKYVDSIAVIITLAIVGLYFCLNINGILTFNWLIFIINVILLIIVMKLEKLEKAPIVEEYQIDMLAELQFNNTTHIKIDNQHELVAKGPSALEALEVAKHYYKEWLGINNET